MGVIFPKTLKIKNISGFTLTHGGKFHLEYDIDKRWAPNSYRWNLSAYKPWLDPVIGFRRFQPSI